MYQYAKQDVKDQPVISTRTPLVHLKQEHMRMVRRVSLRDGWGGEMIATLNHDEHRVLCECVVLKLIRINEAGKFVLDNFAADIMDEHNTDILYSFIGEDRIDLEHDHINIMKVAMFNKAVGRNISGKTIVEQIKTLEKVGFVEALVNEHNNIDFYVTKEGYNFMVDEGYILG